MDISTLSFIGLAITIAVALGAAWPVFRSKSTSATIELLRAELAVEKEARQAELERHQQERAELQGQVAAMTETFAKQVAQHLREKP